MLAAETPGSLPNLFSGFQGDQSRKEAEFQEPVLPEAIASFGLLDKLKEIYSKF